MNAEAGLDASRIVVTIDLCEQQRYDLVPDSEIFRIVVALVLCFEFLEFISRKIPEQLTRNRRNVMHGLKLLVIKTVIDRLVTFNIAIYQLFSGLLYFFWGALLVELRKI